MDIASNIVRCVFSLVFYSINTRLIAYSICSLVIGCLVLMSSVSVGIKLNSKIQTFLFDSYHTSVDLDMKLHNHLLESIVILDPDYLNKYCIDYSLNQKDNCKLTRDIESNQCKKFNLCSHIQSLPINYLKTMDNQIYTIQVQFNSFFTTKPQNLFFEIQEFWEEQNSNSIQ